MANLIGTGLNQVPTNGLLGNMAFQNKEAVSMDLLGVSGNLIVNGNVGIGTSTPARKLEVAGSIRLGDSQNLEWGGNQYYIIGDTGGAMIFGTAGAERMRIVSTGNVGIGTSAPGQRLDVVSAANTAAAYTALFRSTGAAGYSGLIGIGVNPTAAGAYTAAAFGAENVNGTANDGGILKFLTATADASHTLTERMRLDSVGNLGLGVTPSAWSGYKAVQVSNQGSAVYGSTTSSVAGITSNGYYNGTNWIAGNSDTAGRYEMVGNSHRWFTGPSTAFGNVITFTQAMTLDANGNLILGDTTGASGINLVRGSATSAELKLQQTGAGGRDYRITSTGSGYGSAGNLIFFDATASAERMRIDASGNVGIGSATANRAGASRGLSVEGSSTTVIEANRNGGRAGYMYVDSISTSVGEFRNLPLVFNTNDTERARITNTGELLVGTTTAGVGNANALVLATGSTAGQIAIGHVNGTASGQNYANFLYNAGTIGSITQDGTTAVLYNTTSDARLKENVSDADDAADLIDAIQVRKFDWKTDGSHQRYGFVAQELLEVAPEAVSVPSDENEMMGVDYSKLVPMLVKEIQSLRNRVAQLEGE